MDLNTLLNAMRVVSNSGAHPLPGTGPYEPVIDVLPGDQRVPTGLIDRGQLAGPQGLLGLIGQLYPGGDIDGIEKNFRFPGFGGKQPPKEPTRIPTHLPPRPGDVVRDPNRAPGGIFPGGGGLRNPGGMFGPGGEVAGSPQHQFVNPQHLKVLQALIRSGAFKF